MLIKVQKYNFKITLKKTILRKIVFPSHEKMGKIRRCARPGSDPVEIQRRGGGGKSPHSLNNGGYTLSVCWEMFENASKINFLWRRLPDLLLEIDCSHHQHMISGENTAGKSNAKINKCNNKAFGPVTQKPVNI
jgi:hypothetical protein